VKELEFKEKRTYIWNEDIGVTLDGITHFATKKGAHHFITMDGKRHIIAEGWVHCEIESNNAEVLDL